MEARAGSATASWSRTLTLAQGANTITVQATDSRGNIATQSITLNYSSAPVTSVALTSTVASPQNTGTAITFIANSSGGVAPVQFKFLVQPAGGAAQVVQDWSAATTYTWTPATAGADTAGLWARSAGATAKDPAPASSRDMFLGRVGRISVPTGCVRLPDQPIDRKRILLVVS